MLWRLDGLKLAWRPTPDIFSHTHTDTNGIIYWYSVNETIVNLCTSRAWRPSSQSIQTKWNFLFYKNVQYFKIVVFKQSQKNKIPVTQNDPCFVSMQMRARIRKKQKQIEFVSFWHFFIRISLLFFLVYISFKEKKNNNQKKKNTQKLVNIFSFAKVGT